MSMFLGPSLWNHCEFKNVATLSLLSFHSKGQNVRISSPTSLGVKACQFLHLRQSALGEACKPSSNWMPLLVDSLSKSSHVPEHRSEKPRNLACCRHCNGSPGASEIDYLKSVSRELAIYKMVLQCSLLQLLLLATVPVLIKKAVD